MSNLPAKLRAALEKRGITQRDLAELIPMNESTVSLWLSGARTPRMKNLERLAQALGIEMAELWEGPEATPVNAVQQAMIDEMGQLEDSQQEILLALARSMRKA